MKVKEEELLEEISGFLHGYLKSGKVRIHSFFSKINLNIDNLEQLLTIRFLVKKETSEFVKSLPFLLKQIKTTTLIKNETHIGEVKGAVDWSETTKQRLARNYKDLTIFSTNENIRSYNTPESLVLKELLGLLYQALFKNNYIKGFENATWFTEWQKLKENISYAFKKNVYLQRVDRITVSDRIVMKMRHHRSKLYREAANLLFMYRQLINGRFDKEDLKTLLQETFIKPNNIDVLFELYWVVQMIKNNTDNSKLHLMDGKRNIVASWSDDQFLYRLYHDSTGSDELNFKVTGTEITNSDNPYLQQKYKAFTRMNQLAQAFFGKGQSNSIWKGRPDILLEIYDNSSMKLIKIVIGEVKNTQKIDYAITGLEELLTYIHLVKDRKEQYLLGSSVKVEGILCVDNVEIKEGASSQLVKVVKRGDEKRLYMASIE